MFRQHTAEETELIQEGVRRGEGFKEIERMLRARRGEFRGVAAEIMGGINVSAVEEAGDVPVCVCVCMYEYIYVYIICICIYIYIYIYV